MSAENSTGSVARLSLSERARQGLLLSEPTLRLDEIAELECPEHRYGPKMEAWIKRLETACKYGALRLKPGDVFDEFGGWPDIPRENYRVWRATQRDLPDNSVIELWLGAPAADRLPLAERARRGLLAGEPELLLSEILELEFPLENPQAPGPDYQRWQRAIETAEARGRLKAEFVDVLYQGEWYPTGELRIEQESFRAWRIRQSCPPTDSDIDLWLGATPAVETSLPEPSPPEPPASFTKLEKRQRNDAMSNAIRAAIAVLSPSGEPLPQPKALFDYLATRDGTKTIVDSSKEQLTWYTAETGIKKTTTVADLKKRLDRWKD